MVSISYHGVCNVNFIPENTESVHCLVQTLVLSSVDRGFGFFVQFVGSETTRENFSFPEASRCLFNQGR